MPIKNKKDPRGYVLTDLEVLDPASVADYVFNRVGISIPDDQVRGYWRHYRSEHISAPWACRHPAEETAVPVGLYGDACKIRPYEKMVGIFINFPLFRPRSVRCSRFLLVAIQEENMFQRKTLDAIFRFVVWRLNLLMDGKWPSVDIHGGSLTGPALARAGKEIVPNKTFAVIEVRGDWVWLKECLSFKSSWKGGSRYPVCFRCEARATGNELYYNVQKDSSVWQTEYRTLADFLVHQMPAQPSFLVQLYMCFVFTY